MKKILGIDIGGSGIKGAPVNIKKGELIGDRQRVPTPQPSTPDAVGDAVVELLKHFRWKGPIGCAFPAIMKGGIAYSAANVDKSWIGTNAEALLERKTGCPVHIINDADAAGIAEMRFGAGRGRSGVVFVLTLGTGIGSAVFVDGVPMPNTELGHLMMRTRSHDTVEAELYASERMRGEADLGWGEWAGRVNEYLLTVEALFSPDLFILGGGVSRQHDKFLPLLNTRTPVVPAELRNEAGIVGAALAARAAFSS